MNIDPAEVAEADQAWAMFVDVIPPKAWSVFSAFLSEGFTRIEALELTKQSLDRLVFEIEAGSG